MKKLNLKKLELENDEMIQRDRLRRIYGGLCAWLIWYQWLSYKSM